MADPTPSTAQVPPAAAPATQQPGTTTVTPTPAPAAPAPAAPAPATTTQAAAEPAPATNKETPAAAAAVLKIEDLKLPEGSLLDPKVVEEIVSLANAKKLSKEDAQGMLERESKLISSYVEGEKAKATQVQEGWYNAAFADPEIGGGNKELYDKNMELGHRVIKKYGTPAFEKMLKDSGAFEHPEVLRFVIRLGKEHAPDQLVLPGPGAGDSKLPRLADRLYKTEQPAAAPAE